MLISPNLSLPYIDVSQAQREVTHNDAIRALDALVQLAVLDRDLATPPGSPSDGQRWIVAASPTGAWSGHATHVAAWQDGAWRFYVPAVGWFVYVVDEGALIAWNGSGWADAISMLSALQNMTLLGVGTTADSTDPFSAKLNNTLWVAKTVAEGGNGDLRYKMSKASASNTLSLLMQDNFSGRAEIGLTGDDNFHFKVSADGTTWLDSLTIDKTTGKLTVGQGFTDPAGARQQLCAAPVEALAANGLQVNGGMEVSQENGTASVTLTASGSVQTKYLLDGAMAAYRGSFVASAQQVTDAPAGFRNSLKFTVSTAESSLGANDELTIIVPIEGYRISRLSIGTGSAAALSFAFWVKAHRTGTYSGAVKNTNVGGASPRSCPFTFTVNNADTWEYKTVTINTLDTSGTWASGNTAGLYLTIAIAAGSSRAGTAGAWAGSDTSGATGTTNGVAATSDIFQFTGLIVLPGVDLPSSDRTPFIARPFAEEMTRCQRYFEKSWDYGTAIGTATLVGASQLNLSASSATFLGFLASERFKVPKRTAPTMTIYSKNTGASGKVYDAINGADVSGAADNASESGFRWYNVANFSPAPSAPNMIAHWVADARL